MKNFKKYVGFLILLVPFLIASITLTICSVVVSILGLPVFVGAWLLGWVNWNDFIQMVFSPLEILKDLFNEIL